MPARVRRGRPGPTAAKHILHKGLMPWARSGPASPTVACRHRVETTGVLIHSHSVHGARGAVPALTTGVATRQGPGLTLASSHVSPWLSGTTKPSASKVAFTAVMSRPLPIPAASSLSST